MDLKKKNNPVYKKLRDEKARLISFSEVTEYDGCPHARYLHRIEGKKGTQNIYGVAGGLCHDLLEKHYTENLSKDDMIEKFEDGMLEILGSGFRFMTSKVEISWMNNMRLYYQSFETDKDIVNCEEFVAFPLWLLDDELKNTYLQGWTDARLVDVDGNVSLGDFKSSTIFVGEDLKDKSKQLILYSIMYEFMYKIKIKSIFFDFMKYSKIKYMVKGKVKEKIVERQHVYMYDNIISTEKAYVFVELNDEVKKETLEWFIGLVKKMDTETEYKQGDCGDFFCKNLCGYSVYCKYRA